MNVLEGGTFFRKVTTNRRKLLGHCRQHVHLTGDHSKEDLENALFGDFWFLCGKLVSTL